MYSVMDYDPMVLESRLHYPKTLDKSVLVARAQEIQEVLLPESAVHENVVEAASVYMEVTERVGLEAAPFDPSHSSKLDATTEHGEGAKTQSAEEQRPPALIMPYGKGSLVIERQHKGSDSGSPLKFVAKGLIEGGWGAEGNAGGEKKRRRRSMNWNDEETEILVKAVPQLKNSNSRFYKRAGSKSLWEGIANEVPGRTGDECRMRMDTLTKSYKAIKEYCDYQNKEFRLLKEEDFENMKFAKRKLATRFKESWYNHFRDYCPPRSNKKVSNQGAGSPLEKVVDFVSSASTSDERDPLRVEFHNLDAESSKVVITAPDRVNQIKPPLEALEVVLWTRSVTISNGRLRSAGNEEATQIGSLGDMSVLIIV